MSWLVEFEHDESGNRVYVEDDGRVAYAYFVNSFDNTRPGFVWLYNVVEAPDEVNLTQEGDTPVNGKGFIKDVKFKPAKQKDISIYWLTTRGTLEAGIYVRGQLHAILSETSRPGWCILAEGEGLLAKELDLSHRKK